MKRKEMMEDCPEEFKDRLEEIIDDIECTVSDIKDLMDISSVSDINKVFDAFGTIEDLARDLY